MHLVGFTTEIYCDARPYGRQIYRQVASFHVQTSAAIQGVRSTNFCTVSEQQYSTVNSWHPKITVTIKTLIRVSQNNGPQSPHFP